MSASHSTGKLRYFLHLAISYIEAWRRKLKVGAPGRMQSAAVAVLPIEQTCICMALSILSSAYNNIY